MYPGPLALLGSMWATWNVLLLVGVFFGFFMLRGVYFGATDETLPRQLTLRYLLGVYVCALGAQWFAYAFDYGSTILPPDDTSWLRYYFHPLAGAKTLYGAILALPLAVRMAFPEQDFPRMLDRTTPALMAILAAARIGCFLQGCCYGIVSPYGFAFPRGSAVHAEQVAQGIVGLHDHSLPVLPLQFVEAAVCVGLAIWSIRAAREKRTEVFAGALVAYSLSRFTLEFLRADPVRNHLGPLSTSQWVAVFVLTTLTVRSTFAAGRRSATA